MKKSATLFLTFLSVPCFLLAQINYVDFEKKDMITFGTYTGKLDSASKNPMTNEINTSTKCAKYERNKDVMFDNVRIHLDRKMMNTEKYATHEGFPNKLSMKLYSNAPIGTLVELQLGNKMSMDYPSGVNSQFQAYTTAKNQWEELVFIFSEIPAGSAVAFNDVDMITILFSPNSGDSSTYYFDDLMGPDLMKETEQSKKNNR